MRSSQLKREIQLAVAFGLVRVSRSTYARCEDRTHFGIYLITVSSSRDQSQTSLVGAAAKSGAAVKSAELPVSSTTLIVFTNC